MKKELTGIQKDILNYLIDQIKGKGIPPTLAEVADHFGYRNRATVQQHFSAIEKKGFIKKIQSFPVELNSHWKISSSSRNLLLEK